MTVYGQEVSVVDKQKGGRGELLSIVVAQLQQIGFALSLIHSLID